MLALTTLSARSPRAGAVADIITMPPVIHVHALLPVQMIVPRTTEEIVVTRPTNDDITAPAGEDSVASPVTANSVRAGTRPHTVIASPRRDVVPSTAATDHIVASQSLDTIIPSPSRDHVTAIGAFETVVLLCSHDRDLLAEAERRTSSIFPGGARGSVRSGEECHHHYQGRLCHTANLACRGTSSLKVTTQSWADRDGPSSGSATASRFAPSVACVAAGSI
jgi:hypothetical protein